MREILFRGKTPMTDRWVFGSGLLYDGVNTWIVNNPIGQAIAFGETKTIVIPETIGQYTGLTDKNGTKIFEGDIVKYGDTIHKVVFEQRTGTAYFGIVYNELETLPFGHYQDLKQIEVIGNIHDNPELLKGGTDNGHP